MKHILTIIKKELRRIFTDKRVVISLLLPGIMIYILYSVMGNFMFAQPTENYDDYIFKVILINKEDSLVLESSESLTIHNLTTTLTYEEVVEQVNLGIIDLVIHFEEDFLVKYSLGEKPNVDIHYNSNDSASVLIFQEYRSFINSNLDQYILIPHDEISESELSVTLILSIVPFLLITFLFSGSMAISIESVAGEKERGTIATLLATPVRRSDIAIGKLIALSIGAITSALSSFIGLMLSLPNLFGGIGISLDIYGPLTYVLLFFVLVSTVLIFVILISIISAFAKTIKEANSLVVPLMVVVMLLGFSSMIVPGEPGLAQHFIPVLNSVLTINAILGQSVNMTYFIITLLVNLLTVGVGVLILARMFNSEKIMFSK